MYTKTNITIHKHPYRFPQRTRNVYHREKKENEEGCSKKNIPEISSISHVRLAHKCIMLGPPTIGVGATISMLDGAENA